jgi:hypothetical protein
MKLRRRINMTDKPVKKPKTVVSAEPKDFIDELDDVIEYDQFAFLYENNHGFPGVVICDRVKKFVFYH